MPINKQQSDASVLTDQLVSQLLYCRSRIQYEDFNELSDEIIALLSTYEKKIKKLKI